MYGSLQKKIRKVKRCIYQSKEEVNEQFGRKMNQYVNGSRKLVWKEVKVVIKEKSCSRIKDKIRSWHWERIKC